MDRTSWIAVLVCTGLLFLWGWNQQRVAKEYREAQIAYLEKQKAEEAKNPKPDPSTGGTTQLGTNDPAPATGNQPEVDPSAAKEETFDLSNELVTYEFTTKGGGINAVKLLEYNRLLDDPEHKVELNQASKYAIGSISPGPKQYDQSIWTLANKTENSITFSTTTPNKLEYQKTFTLAGEGQDPYELNLEINIKNLSGTQVEVEASPYLYLGSAAPLSPNEWSMQLGIFWMADGDYESKTVDHFKGGWFGDEKLSDTFIAEDFEWAGVHGQYFSTMVKADAPYNALIWGSRIPVEMEGKEPGKYHAAEAAVSILNTAIPDQFQVTRKFELYAGPKQLERLAKLDGTDRKDAMDYDRIPIFGWLFGWAIKPLASGLAWALHWFHGMGIAWGYAIILITICIRILIWPVYAKSTRTMKRMSKLTPKMKEIKEKHADNPQKMNQETMALYSKYGVNPLGGCLPMFIQLPVFLSFYRMLWSEVDLRHEDFWWVTDLSMPDTQFVIAGVPINPLPILMAVTTFIQMSLTPKTGDKTQRMIFMLMPFIFLFICYNFAAALSLYWTTQNIFSIFQTWLMNKLPEPELKKKKKSGFMQRLQEQAEQAQKARKAGGGGGATPPGPGSRTKMPGEKGDRHQKSKKKKKK